ncbi:MAG: RNA-binding domain-containing protein [Methanotrichaceae archaeon]
MLHRITFRAFVAATEAEERVYKALSIFVPLDSIITTAAMGHFGNDIKILEATLKRKDGLIFFRILREQLPREDLLRLRRELSARIDDSCHFHLRLDKQAAYKGMVHLTDSKDAIDVTASIATYPANREEAMSIAGELL